MAKVVKYLLICVVPLVITVLVTYASLTSINVFPTEDWFAKIPYMDKLVHFLFYFVMAASLKFMLGYFFRYTISTTIFIILFVSAYGGAIELLQGMYFERSSDIFDELANILGAVVSTTLLPKRYFERIWILLKQY